MQNLNPVVAYRFETIILLRLNHYNVGVGLTFNQNLCVVIVEMKVKIAK